LEVERVFEEGVDVILCDAEPFENFLFCRWFDGFYVFYAGGVGAIGADKMVEEEDKVFFRGAVVFDV
jgi:hypothetical protein